MTNQSLADLGQIDLHLPYTHQSGAMMDLWPKKTIQSCPCVGLRAVSGNLLLVYDVNMRLSYVTPDTDIAARLYRTKGI